MKWIVGFIIGVVVISAALLKLVYVPDFDKESNP